MTKRRMVAAASVVGLYTGLAILLTYPLAWNLDSAIIGGPGDNFQFVWNFWWVKRAVLELHTNPYITDMLYYPNGFNLGLHSHTMALSLLSIPFQFVLPVETVYNLFVLGGVMANALAAYYLAAHVTNDRPAAVLAGVIFGFSPIFFAHVAGHLNCLHAWVLPLFLVFQMRWLEKGRLRHACFAAGVLAISAMINEYFTIFIAFMWLILLVHYWKDKQQPFRTLVLRSGFCLLVAGLILAPDIYLRRAAFAQPDQVAGWSRPLSADLLSFVTPGWFHPLLGDIVTKLTRGQGAWFDPEGAKWEAITFLGFTALLLAMYAVLKVDRAKTRLWMYLAVFFAVMSLGPVLHIGGRFAWDPEQLGLSNISKLIEPVYEMLGVRSRQLGVPLPYLLYSKIPYLNAARVASRWIVVTALSVSILAALGLNRLRASLFAKQRPRLMQYANVALLLMVVFESLAVPFPMTPIKLPRTYEAIIADPSQFAILELPIGLAAGADDMYFQTKHANPLLHAQVSRGAESARSFIEEDPFLSLLLHPERIRKSDGAPVTAVFKEYRIKYIIVNDIELEEFTRLYGGSPALVYDLLDSSFEEIPSNDSNRRLFETYSGSDP